MGLGFELRASFILICRMLLSAHKRTAVNVPNLVLNLAAIGLQGGSLGDQVVTCTVCCAVVCIPCCL